MKPVVTEALRLWSMADATAELVAARENEVFRAFHAGNSFAVRLHRRGYRTDAELTSELAWMDAAARGGISVPAPVTSTTGTFLHLIEGYQVDVLTWLPGAPLSTPGGPLTVPDRTGTYHQLGKEMARLHEVSDAWALPQGFTRCRWDREGLLGPVPVWDRFWDNPGLSGEDRALMLAFRAKARDVLEAREGTLDFGLIHADLVTANVMSHEGRLSLIDFDDGGFGFRLFDVATALLKQMNEPDFADLKAALISGYHSVRHLDLETLDLFLALRATTYLGWNITRMNETGTEGRNARFIDAARGLVRRYLDNI